MIIAAFSDVHGNIDALKKTITSIEGNEPDAVVFLGDIFQRGNSELECLELLMSKDIICVKGNCELYLLHGVDIDPDVEQHREYYETARKSLSSEQLQFVKDLPLYYEMEVAGKKIRFSHFLFNDIAADYPFLQLSDLENGVFDKACESEKIIQYELVVIGHSHKNFARNNVVSVSATGLLDASYLLIEADESGIRYKRFSIL